MLRFNLMRVLIQAYTRPERQNGVFRWIGEVWNGDFSTPFTGELNDNVRQTFVNYVLIGLHYDLDNQLLNQKGELDYSFLDFFDINNEVKDGLIQTYKIRRGIVE